MHRSANSTSELFHLIKLYRFQTCNSTYSNFILTPNHGLRIKVTDSINMTHDTKITAMCSSLPPQMAVVEPERCLLVAQQMHWQEAALCCTQWILHAGDSCQLQQDPEPPREYDIVGGAQSHQPQCPQASPAMSTIIRAPSICNAENSSKMCKELIR